MQTENLIPKEHLCRQTNGICIPLGRLSSAEHSRLIQLFSFDPYESEATKLLQTPVFLKTLAIATVHTCTQILLSCLGLGYKLSP